MVALTNRFSAWRSNKIESSGLLAPLPDCFRDSGDIVLRPDKRKLPFDARGVYQMASQGLRFPAPFAFWFTSKKKEVELTLKCWIMQQGKWRAVVLFLSNVGGY